MLRIDRDGMLSSGLSIGGHLVFGIILFAGGIVGYRQHQPSSAMTVHLVAAPNAINGAAGTSGTTIAPVQPAQVPSEASPVTPAPAVNPAPLDHGLKTGASVAPAHAFGVGAASSPAANAGVDGAIAMRFQQALEAHIARFRRPVDAPAGLRPAAPVVGVRFAMDREGHVLDAWVHSSSGVDKFDDEALATIHRAEPLPPIPPALPERFEILMPVAFTVS